LSKSNTGGYLPLALPVIPSPIITRSQLNATKCIQQKESRREAYAHMLNVHQVCHRAKKMEEVVSHLQNGRIAAAHERFNRIRQMAPMCTLI